MTTLLSLPLLAEQLNSHHNNNAPPPLTHSGAQVFESPSVTFWLGGEPGSIFQSEPKKILISQVWPDRPACSNPTNLPLSSEREIFLVKFAELEQYLSLAS